MLNLLELAEMRSFSEIRKIYKPILINVFFCRAELFAARGNMRDPGQPNNVAWAFNIGARTAGMIGGNVVATPARVHSIVINSVSDCEDCEHCCQNNTYTVNYEIRFFEI
jgi:hypothetical protein